MSESKSNTLRFTNYDLRFTIYDLGFRCKIVIRKSSIVNYLNDIAVFDTDDSLGGVGYGLFVGYNYRGDALGV